MAEAVLLNKIDAMSAFDFDEDAFVESVRRLNGLAPIFRMSAKTGEGVAEWAEWLSARIEASRAL
jgi:hydrogenase nickel incorporation protein HypB